MDVVKNQETYMTDFIRDPRTGGCAVGKPPLNLGLRQNIICLRSIFSDNSPLAD